MHFYTLKNKREIHDEKPKKYTHDESANTDCVFPEVFDGCSIKRSCSNGSLPNQIDQYC